MTENTVPDKVCAHCQQPLNRWTKGGVETWRHPGLEEPGHEAVPIPRSEATHVQNKCDFCGDDHPVWVYPTSGEITTTLAAQQFTDERERKQFAEHWDTESNKPGLHKDLMQNHFSDQWTACAACSVYIEIPDVERLITYLRRYKPETFARVTRTLLKQHFAEFFRTKGERQPLARPGEDGARPGSFHDHTLPSAGLPPDPDGLAIDLLLINELVGAGVERCLPCQEKLIKRVVSDSVTTYGLVDMALRGMNDRIGFVPNGMVDPDADGERPGVMSTGFRRVAHTSANGTARPAAADAAGQLTEAERRTVVNESLDLIMGLLST